jgi:hypothetical protein
MVAGVTREEAIAQLDSELDRVACEAASWLAGECGLKGREWQRAMQQVLAKLAQLRAQNLEEIEKILALADARDPGTTVH